MNHMLYIYIYICRGFGPQRRYNRRYYTLTLQRTKYVNGTIKFLRDTNLDIFKFKYVYLNIYNLNMYKYQRVKLNV